MSIPAIPTSCPPSAPAGGVRLFDVQRVREDFPILRQKVRGKPLVYLDNAATTQKPQAVLDALQHYYAADNANIHRGVHLLSERATAGLRGGPRQGAGLPRRRRRPRDHLRPRHHRGDQPRRPDLRPKERP